MIKNLNWKKIDKYAVSVIFIITVVVMIIKFAILDHKGKIIDLDYHFEGVVDSVSYDIKGNASVIIKGAHFFLGDPSWDFDHNRIHKGDSLIKKRNSMIIKLIRSNGEVILEGEEDK